VNDSGKKSRGRDIFYYIQVLNLAAIVRGDKLGVPKHHAYNLLQGGTLADEAKNMLANHLELAELAEKLSPNSREHLTASVCSKALQAVIIDAKTECDEELEKSLLKARFKDLALSPECTKEEMQTLTDVVRPWHRPGKPVEKFDVLQPKLSASSLPMKERMSMKAGRITSGLLIPLITKGLEGHGQLKVICSRLIDFGEEVNELTDTIDDNVLASALEFLSLARAMHAMLSGSLAEIAERMKDLRTLHSHMGTVGHSLHTVVGNAVKREEWFAARLDTIVGSEEAILRGAEIIAEALDQIEDVASQSWDKRVPTLAGIAKHLTKMQAGL